MNLYTIGTLIRIKGFLKKVPVKGYYKGFHNIGALLIRIGFGGPKIL